MEIAAFLSLLMICSVMTGLITEAIKKSVGDIKEPNILAGGVSLLVGLIVGVAYFFINKLDPNFLNVVSIPLLALFSWLCAMLGYDKVVQTIMQIKSDK